MVQAFVVEGSVYLATRSGRTNAAVEAESLLRCGEGQRWVRLAAVAVEDLEAVAGLFGGVAGVMQYGRLTVGDPTTAIGLELDVIAAVVIGGGSLSGGRGSIAGALLGAFFMSVLANGCTLTGVPTYVQEILVGTIIVVAVALDRLRAR